MATKAKHLLQITQVTISNLRHLHFCPNGLLTDLCQQTIDRMCCHKNVTKESNQQTEEGIKLHIYLIFSHLTHSHNHDSDFN